MVKALGFGAYCRNQRRFPILCSVPGSLHNCNVSYLKPISRDVGNHLGPCTRGGEGRFWGWDSGSRGLGLKA